ncbi:MAG TPA: hypothetical protein VHE30_13515 [Polyangiaceae bacterium]|nr:hypothetical protein [Polyangiaceae bacterium]
MNTPDTALPQSNLVFSPVPGAGADSSEALRPGVPMEIDPPHRTTGAHWSFPDRQRDPGNVLKRADLELLTPVFGTTLPPRALSGAIRRVAYRIPEHWTSHWLLLRVADRVDAAEDRTVRFLPFAIPLILGGAVVALTRSRKR